jgi:hypothetical protein
MAKRGLSVDGIELNPILVICSRRAVKKAELGDKAHIIWGNLWQRSFSSYDLVTLYAIPHIMPKLEAKLNSELKPGSIALSNYFTFPNKKPANSTYTNLNHETNNR